MTVSRRSAKHSKPTKRPLRRRGATSRFHFRTPATPAPRNLKSCFTLFSIRAVTKAGWLIQRYAIRDHSLEVWEWLKFRNREGEIPDGAMIVKEMFPSPARQDAKLTGWTVMVKDKKAVFDGWYWSYHAPNYAPANPSIDYPDSGFGLYCLRCHASAEKESTFSTVKNVEGSPISFNIEIPTMLPLPPPKEDMHSQIARRKSIDSRPFATPRTSPDPNFLALFKG